MDIKDYYSTGYVVVSISQRKWFATVMGAVMYCVFLKNNGMKFRVFDCQNGEDITEEATKDCL